MADGIGIDGWKLEVYTAKNKLAPSQHAITCIFDKNTGINKFWSEYEFLSEQLPGEKKLYKGKVMPFPLMIKKNGSFVKLSIKNPDNPDIKYISDNFYRKDAKKKYESDEQFRQWFDYAVQLSTKHRIVQGIFRQKEAVQESILNVQDDSKLDVEFEEVASKEAPQEGIDHTTITEAVEETTAPVIEDKYVPQEGVDHTTITEAVEETTTPVIEDKYVPQEGEEGYQSVFSE